MAFGLLALVAALALLIGAVGVTVLALEPGSTHRALLIVAVALMGLLALLAAGIGWLGMQHGHGTLYRAPYRPL